MRLVNGFLGVLGLSWEELAKVDVYAEVGTARLLVARVTSASSFLSSGSAAAFLKR